MPGQHGLDHAGLALKRISLNLTLPLQLPSGSRSTRGPPLTNPDGVTKTYRPAKG